MPRLFISNARSPDLLLLPPPRPHCNTSAAPTVTTATHTPHTPRPTMPGLVSDATRIWELNVYWPQGSQCGVWDAKSKGVDIWECIRARAYSRLLQAVRVLTAGGCADTAYQGSGPPNPRYWRYVTRR